MKVVSTKRVGIKPVYDLSVADVEHYVLKNGIVSHNTGVTYMSNTILFVGKRQVKEGTELAGYDFVLKNNKSRDIKEGSSIPLRVKFNGGIDPFSGLLDLAQELGYVVKPSRGWYSRVFYLNGAWKQESKKWRESDTESVEFWSALFKHEPFREAVKEKYRLGVINSDEDLDNEVADLLMGGESDLSEISFVDGPDAEEDLDKFE